MRNARAREDKGNTPMIKAAAAGRKRSSADLVTAGADVGERTCLVTQRSRKPRAKVTHKLFRQLFEKGANLNAQTSFGNTALMRASYKEHVNESRSSWTEARHQTRKQVR